MKQHWHHHTKTAFDYFEWKERGIIGHLVHYCFPSPVAVVWAIVFFGVLAALALATVAIELPGGW